MSFDKLVQETKYFEPQTINDVYEFVKSVYEYVIPDNKEPGEHGFNVLDYIAMEQLGAWLKKKEIEDAALTAERDALIAELKLTARYKMSNGTLCWCEALPKGEAHPDFGHSTLCQGHRAALADGEVKE